MTKGQSIIIQFLTFFLVGFFIFLSIGIFFRYQSNLFRQNVLSSNINLTSSYLSSIAIVLADSCKECDFASQRVKIQNATTGYPLKVEIKDSTLETSAPTTSELMATTIHNMLLDTLKASGSSSSTKPIILTFTRTNYTLEVK